MIIISLVALYEDINVAAYVIAILSPVLCYLGKNANYSEDEKVSRYRLLLQQLQPINYVTSRKLFGHLHFIHLENKKNLMTARNLAAIWGISLMHQQPVSDPTITICL